MVQSNKKDFCWDNSLSNPNNVIRPKKCCVTNIFVNKQYTTNNYENKNLEHEILQQKALYNFLGIDTVSRGKCNIKLTYAEQRQRWAIIKSKNSKADENCCNFFGFYHTKINK